jgi:hypothetical protein
LYVLTVIISHAVAIAGEKTKEIKPEGCMDMGFGYYYGSYSVSDFTIYNNEFSRIMQVTLDYKINLPGPFQAIFDFRGDLDKYSVRMQKGYIGIKTSPASFFRIGVMRKNLGWEEMTSEQQLYTINRSYANQLFDSFGLLGHDMLVEYGYNQPVLQDGLMKCRVAGGADAQKRRFGTIAFELTKKWGSLLTSNVVAMGGNQSTSSVTTFGYSNTFGSTFTSCEVYGGIDPNATYTMTLIGEKQHVLFSGLRGLITYTFNMHLWQVTGVEPLISTVYIVSDPLLRLHHTVQFAPGINLYFDQNKRVRWMTDGEFLFTNSPAGMPLQSSAFYTQLQVTW